MTSAAVENVASPCNSVCRMDPRSGFCEGCWRTIDEIAAWAVLDDDEKRAVWDALARRESAAQRAQPASQPSAIPTPQPPDDR